MIGSGASAIQFVPEIQPKAAHLTVYQRTPPWVFPKPDRIFQPEQRQRFGERPASFARLRTFIYWLNETRVPGLTGHSAWFWRLRRLARRYRERTIRDPVLLAKVTPRYALGCKRILISSDYYPALCQSNVEVVTEPVASMTSAGLVTSDGRERAADVVIFGTGFDLTAIIPVGMMTGIEGRDLGRVWREGGAEAYKGTTVAGFPNLFVLLGPNTGLGHNSVVVMIEAQIQYVMTAMRFMEANGIRSVEVRESAQKAWNARLQKRLKRSVWNTGGCRSWYLHPVTGRNTAIWPGFTWRFVRELRSFDPGAYTLLQPGRKSDT